MSRPKVSAVVPLSVRALKIPSEEVAFFAPAGSPKAASRAITGVLKALRTFFGLPAPVQAALTADMRAQGMKDVRDYLTWLCVQRHGVVELAARGEQ